ncbi:putative photosynthetic complex assembly protein PuhE [Mesorhizobium sp. VNQ89]|uniref:putative photosynthetic complex assembly protein PuhE n=1 Tax=Mesorhizobium quangtriensis TaxID=3157709 RepID=UPI0032B7D15A
MTAYLWPIVFALFVWWFSTGAIIYLDGLPVRTFKWSMLGATALFGAALYGLAVSSGDTSVQGAYIAFASALAAWAWHEISFYMGYVTGPRKHACREGCSGWAHLGHALQVSLWHELAIIASFLVVAALTWGGANQIGLWTFVILWWMHESARLNVVLGVRNVNAHFLPPHLAYLKSFLNQKPMNLLFPISVTVSTIICAVLGTEAALATDPFEQAGFTFLATMMTLAIVEHWFLVLPLPAEQMWSWSLKSRDMKKRPHGMRQENAACNDVLHRHDSAKQHSPAPIPGLGSVH